MSNILIFPDIHGRTFWENPLNDAISKDIINEIVFLGDYFDPYYDEGITVEDSITNFKHLIEVLNSIKDKVKISMLIGNHDLHYINDTFYKYGGGSRFSKAYSKEIKELLLNCPFNLTLSYETNVNGDKVLFTHAGVSKEWEERHFPNGVTVDGLNNLLNDSNGAKALSEVGYERWGEFDGGSIVWNDVDNKYISKYCTNGYDYEIFGHSQQLQDPVITDKFAMLDCRKAFLLKGEGFSITPYEVAA